MKYPRHAPKRDPNVAIKAILNHSCFRAIVIGIISTSGGIGNIKLSIKKIILKVTGKLLLGEQ